MNDRPRAWLLRLSAGILLAVCGTITAMLATHRSAHPIVGGYSFPALAALAIASVACIGLLILLLLPAAPRKRFQSWLREGMHSIRIDVPRGSAGATLVLAALALSSYAIIGTRSIQINTAPLHDQYDYLNVAAQIGTFGAHHAERDGYIQRVGGLFELWRQLWSGEYLEANRHPLYTAVLSLRPDFTWGKALSWFLGLCTLGLLWWRTTRRSGGLVGGLSAVLLATNSVFQQSASLVACEAMLMLWTLLAWFGIEQVLGCTRPACRSPVEGVAGGSRRAGTPQLLRNCAAIGAWLGLAYLTKASAFFLLVGFGAWSFSVPRLRRWSWLALVAFGLVSSPLLVRNLRAYGDPLYSFNNRFLFADSFEQGVSRDDRGFLVGAREYWQTHSATDIGRRAVSGLAWETFILLRSLGPATLSDSRPLVGFVFLLMAGLGAIGTDRRIVLAAIAWLVPVYAFFAWYVPIAAGDRFLAPIVPVFLMFAARGTVQLFQASASGSDARLDRRVVCAAALWCIAVTMLSFKDSFGELRVG